MRYIEIAKTIKELARNIPQLLSSEGGYKMPSLKDLVLHLPVPKPINVAFLDFCLNGMLSPAETVAGQAVCMKLAYAICRKEAPAPIGYVHVSGNDSHDLGYGLKKEFWHKGFCTEACQAVIGQLKQTGIPYITATHDVNNPRSGKVMQALGMKYQYSYEELWQPKNFLVTFRMYQLNFDKEKDRVYRKYWDKYPIHFIEDLTPGAELPSI